MLGHLGRVGSVPQSNRPKAGPGEVRLVRGAKGKYEPAAPQLRRVVEAQAVTSGKNCQVWGRWSFSAENAQSDETPWEWHELKCVQRRGAGRERLRRRHQREWEMRSAPLSGKRETPSKW